MFSWVKLGCGLARLGSLGFPWLEVQRLLAWLCVAWLGLAWFAGDFT